MAMLYRNTCYSEACIMRLNCTWKAIRIARHTRQMRVNKFMLSFLHKAVMSTAEIIEFLRCLSATV